MTKTQKILFTLLRLALGWLFIYAAYQKLSDPAWSASGYLLHAQTLSSFYSWLASDGMIGITNALNAYGQLAIGISLLLGLFIRVGSFFGALMMILYYLPILVWPHPNEHAFIVDEHIVYALCLLLLGAFQAGRIYGADGILRNWYERKRIAWLG